MPAKILQQASSINHAMELCLNHARKKRNFNVDRISDQMGLANKWQLYRWLENGRMPMILIRAFESACGANFITRYIAHSNHKLLIDIPSGRKADHKELNDLGMAMNQTIACLMEFHQGKTNADETLGAITSVMESLAWHRMTVEKTTQPEFDFEGDAS